MIGRQAIRQCFISLLLLLIGTSIAVAEPFTRRSSQVQHDGLKKTYEIANFRLGGKYDLADPSKWENGGDGGVTLESLGAGKLRTAYIAIGNARRNAAGEITNAVVINSYYSGDSTDMYEQWVRGAPLSGGVPIIGPGRPINTDRYYVIMVDPLGTWGASKPSDGLGIKFPQYSYFDMVQANYRMLRDHLKVARVALVTGVSMGGTQTYVWGVMHPEYVQALMPIGGTTQSDAEDPVGNWTFQLMTAAIESDPVWQATKGNYYNLPKEKHPLPGVAFGWSVLVLIHGKGAFAGHYGNVIKQAVESGIRVIAPDLPHYGMSGPGNLDKNPARSMQDMRDVVHELVVNQLGVKQAYYLGHSLGGQVVLGYALTWPDAVRGLILEAPAGLEEYPRQVPVAPGKTAKLYDASF